MHVLMLPHITQFKNDQSGIRRVVEAYFKHLPEFGVEFVHPNASDFDVLAAHAGITGGECTVAHTHGLYWNADYNANLWQYQVNERVIDAIRHAREITVPSAWVAESFQRDMRFTPHIVPHGIDWQEWQHNEPLGDYVLYNKNRQGDVCNAMPVIELARRFNRQHFVSTFVPHNTPAMSNINTIGLIPYDQMRLLVQSALVYLSTTKETFGIGVLEAMASGTPVLGFAHGGNVELIKHGINGYLAKPGDYEDLADGLEYCLQHRATLGANGQEMAKRWTWEAVCEQVAGIYQQALEDKPATCAVVIPVYNKTEEEITRAVESVVYQRWFENSNLVISDEIIIVNDGSDEETSNACRRIVSKFEHPDFAIVIKLIEQQNSGVAIARNRGIAETSSEYVCCLDADDWIGPRFLDSCIKELKADRSLGIVYTGLKYYKPDGETGLSSWPTVFDFDKQLQRQNQIPTCCVFRREVWERLGGYRQRYAPKGCGSEDAEYWTRAGAYGWNAKQVMPEQLDAYRVAQNHYGREPTRDEVVSRGMSYEDFDLMMDSLFHYSWLSGMVTGDPNYQEPDWLAWHPWVKDKQHPFASLATPERYSHPVRQYDEPAISVIIPVGPGHEEHVINALDSLEAQTFRKWEVIIVDDTWGTDPTDDAPRGLNKLYELTKAYPYVKYVTVSEIDSYLPNDIELGRYGYAEIHRMNDGKRGSKGPGYARNRGAEIARAPFLFFLDADDWLYPDSLQRHIDYWNEHQAIPYSDYVGRTYIDNPADLDPVLQERLYYHDNNFAVIGYRAADYNCERAQSQPQDNVFVWCNVTTLVPKAWHDEIDGFDEELESWEDVDYHWRLAKAGKCYHRIPEELMVYNFHQGHRRERGRQDYENLLYSLKRKHERIEPMACKGCGGNKKKSNSNSTASVFARAERRQVAQQQTTIEDADFVLCTYSPRGKGAKKLTGAAVFQVQIPGWPNIRRGESAYSINYGRRDLGDRFLVHRKDIALNPTVFIPIVEREVTNVPEPVEEPLPVPELVEGAEVRITRDGSSINDTLSSNTSQVPPSAPSLEVEVKSPAITKQHRRNDGELDKGELLELASILVEGETDEETEPREFDLQMLPGVGPSLAYTLRQNGVTSRETLLSLGADGLSGYKGVGLVKAERIIQALERLDS